MFLHFIIAGQSSLKLAEGLGMGKKKDNKKGRLSPPYLMLNA